MKKTLTLLALAVAVAGAQAQSTPPAGQTSLTGSTASSASSPAKKELVQKVLQLQQPAIEAMARQLVEQPAAQMLQQAGIALQQRVPAEQREAVAKDIQTDARKYADDTVPIVRKRAVDLAPSTIGTVLEEKFSEDELKQLVAILESPVNKRYQQLGGDMQNALSEKLVADSRSSVEPKLRDLEQSIGKRLGLTPPSAGTAPAATAPAKAASKPAAKKP